MKKALLTVLALGATAGAVAAPMSTTFTGPAVELGAGVSKTDIKNSNLDKKAKPISPFAAAIMWITAAIGLAVVKWPISP